MSSWSLVEACLALGDAHGALIAAASLREGEDLPHLRERRLRQALGPALERWPQLPGCLAGEARVWGRTVDLPVLAAIFAPARPEIGAALFPVALPDRGIVRLFRVSSEPPAAHRPRDPAFLEAVGLARQAVEQALGEDLPTDASWSVLPELASNELIEGGSVGLAAIVAFASFALRRSPNAADVFTGCLKAEGRAVFLAPVAAASLPFKAAAAARLQPGAVGVCFYHPVGNAEPDTHNLRARPVKAGFRDWLSSAELFGPLPSPTFVAAPRLSDEAREVLFLLLAARAPVQAQILGRALAEGARLGEALTELEREGLAEAFNGRWQARPSPLPERDPLAMVRAHRAWGNVEGPLGPACWHLLSAGEAAAAAHRLAESEPGSATVVLAQLHDELPEANRLTPLIEALPLGDTADLLRLVHAAMGLPPWLARLGRRLAEHATWTDRLLTLQALIEASLHLLVASALAEGLVAEATRKELDRRPSVGLLRRACEGLEQPRAGLSPAVVLLAQTNPAGWTRGLAPLDHKLNLALHQKLALGRLACGDEEGARLSVLALVPESLALFGSIARAVSQGLDVREEAAGTGELVAVVDGIEGVGGIEGRALSLSPWLRRARVAEGEGAATLFLRGEFEGGRRWWSFESALAEWESRAPNPPLSDPGRLALDTVPTPLAVAWVHMQRAQGGLDRLAAADLLLFVLLRLVAGPLLAAALAEAEGQLRKPWDHRLRRMNHRNLFDLALDQAPGALADWMRQPEVRAQVAWLIDRVERHQHAPGPCASWDGRGVQEAARALLASGPWAGVALALDGVALRGVAPKLRAQSAWRCLDLVDGDERRGLGPIVGLPSGSTAISLLVQIDSKAKHFADAAPCWRRLSPDTLWEAPSSGALGERRL